MNPILLHFLSSNLDAGGKFSTEILAKIIETSAMNYLLAKHSLNHLDDPAMRLPVVRMLVRRGASSVGTGATVSS
jgi:hypothetical protein